MTDSKDIKYGPGAPKFTAFAAKSHRLIAGDLADDIKTTIYRYAHLHIPLALVIGVLRIVEKELLDEGEGTQ